MASVLLSVELGAAGRPTLTYLIEKAMGTNRATTLARTSTLKPPSTLAPIAESSILLPTPHPSEREALKLQMLRTMRPLPLQHVWTFHHSTTTSTKQSRPAPTTLMAGISTIKTFWEVHNQFPLHALPGGHSVHFFKRGVTPTWDDARNVKGGAWTMQVAKATSKELWTELLLLAIGEQFADAVLPGDDLCGLSFSTQPAHDVLTIWNRDASNLVSVQGILGVVLEHISPGLLGEGPRSYQKHSERPGFGDVVAAAAAAAGLARWAKFACV